MDLLDWIVFACDLCDLYYFRQNTCVDSYFYESVKGQSKDEFQKRTTIQCILSSIEKLELMINTEDFDPCKVLFQF